MAAPTPVPNDYTQPALPTPQKGGWYFNSVDFQIMSKEDGWNQGQTERLNEYQEVVNIGNVNYVALATPYDELTKFTNYVTDARSKGFKINFRSHWNAWQGDNGVGNIATTASLTSSGTTATCVTSTAHGLNVGDTVSMNGMNETTYRGEFAVVTVPNSTTFTYTLPSSTTSPATGAGIGWRWGRQTYLDHTYDFIVANPTLFQAGDMFALCVEAEEADSSNMTFKTPGTTTFDYGLYNQFLKDQVRYANWAFQHCTGLGGTIHTWPISLGISNLNLNGQTVNTGGSTSTGNSSGLGDSDIVTYFAGRLTLDHYIDSSVSTGPAYYTQYDADLTSFAAAFPSCQFMMGEWGFHTQTDYGDGVQYGVYDLVCQALRKHNKIIGVNFWNNLGQLSSSIWKDNSGTVIPGGRRAVEALRRHFSCGNATTGARARV